MEVPLWILGSSHFGAMLARPNRAALRLCVAFRARIILIEALAIYRSRFLPSEQLDKPYAMVGVNVVAAETDAPGEAAGDDTADVVFTGIFRGARARPAADRRYRDLLVARREGAGDADAAPLYRWFTGVTARAGIGSVDCRNRCGRIDRGFRCLRSLRCVCVRSSADRGSGLAFVLASRRCHPSCINLGLSQALFCGFALFTGVPR